MQLDSQRYTLQWLRMNSTIGFYHYPSMTSSPAPTEQNSKLAFYKCYKPCATSKVHFISGTGTILILAQKWPDFRRNDIYRELTTQLHDTWHKWIWFTWQKLLFLHSARNKRINTSVLVFHVDFVVGSLEMMIRTINGQESPTENSPKIISNPRNNSD